MGHVQLTPLDEGRILRVQAEGPDQGICLGEGEPVRPEGAEQKVGLVQSAAGAAQWLLSQVAQTFLDNAQVRRRFQQESAAAQRPPLHEPDEGRAAGQEVDVAGSRLGDDPFWLTVTVKQAISGASHRPADGPLVSR